MNETHQCSFCGKTVTEVSGDPNASILIKNDHDSSICDGCVEVCVDLIGSARAKMEEEERKARPAMINQAVAALKAARDAKVMASTFPQYDLPNLTDEEVVRAVIGGAASFLKTAGTSGRLDLHDCYCAAELLSDETKLA